MHRNGASRVLVGLLICLALSLGIGPAARLFLGPIASVRLIKGMEQDLSFKLPISLSIIPPTNTSLTVNDILLPAKTQSSFKAPVRVRAESVGTMTVDLRLFGFIPVRRMVMDVLPAVKVIPGGQAIGVLLNPKGVIVIAHTSLEGIDGIRRYPAEEAGVRTGDVILRINGEEAKSTEGVSMLVAKYAAQGKPLSLDIKRGGKPMTIPLTPVLTRTEGGSDTSRVGAEYKMGLYVEDNVAGVGTLTFYEPGSGKYAALGHVITDGSTNQRVAIRDGRIVRAGISGIQLGAKGQPGEKIGTFEGGGDIAGDIKKNTDFGIYGKLTQQPKSDLGALPIAVSSQIREGSAEMLTVVTDNKVERFKVEIQRIYRQDHPETKGLVVKVVDPRLLRLTGGIIQGMSGSPLIQNGRLIGAVTHVFVNDPTRGYGVLAEWMVKEADLAEKAVPDKVGKSKVKGAA